MIGASASRHAARIGFMQGRLSPQVDAKIQAFPWAHWQDEFPAAAQLGFRLLEWTLDHDRLHENPLMTPSGRIQIQSLAKVHNVRVSALTGDLFMQAPFWKSSGSQREVLVAELDAVLDACSAIGITEVVVPLVDNGKIDGPGQADVLAEVLLSRADRIIAGGQKVVFESDFGPKALADFLSPYPTKGFGVNYDIGNSASLGHDCGEEIAAYGQRILHVHVKDRLIGGGTVPLGAGNAELSRVIGLIERAGYTGDYILQTARADNGEHASALVSYRDMVVTWLDV